MNFLPAIHCQDRYATKYILKGVTPDNGAIWPHCQVYYATKYRKTLDRPDNELQEDLSIDGKKEIAAQEERLVSK